MYKKFIPVCFAVSCLLGCEQTKSNSGFTANRLIPPLSKQENYPGGKTTLTSSGKFSFIQPLSGLSEKRKVNFYAGKALAGQPWIKAPTITKSRDGLGPLYNARTCLACHKNGGRGSIPRDSSQVLFSTLVRLSLPNKRVSVGEFNFTKKEKILGVIPEPNYGDQIQTQSIALAHQLRHLPQVKNFKVSEVAAEAYPVVEWEKIQFKYADDTAVELSKPQIRFENLAYGELHSETLTSLRVAPPLLGVGLLEAIDSASIERLADPDDNNQDGISGRVNQVWDFVNNQRAPGRFGLKANRPNLYNLIAAAFANDIGITNHLFPDQPCTKKQVKCQQSLHGSEFLDEQSIAVELSDSLLQLSVDFISQLAVPARRHTRQQAVITGRKYFYQVGCQLCHQPSYVTSKSIYSNLENQTIWPYTDLLLHDMGAGLADGRPDYQASGNEWRTPPLWGVGLAKQVNGHQNYLHDGRARTIEEAILWHGGEASAIQRRFTRLKEIQREKLIAFVNSL